MVSKTDIGKLFKPQKHNKAIVDIRLHPQCAIPPPPLQPITDSSNACNQAFAPIVCTLIHGPVQFAIRQGC